MGIQRQKAPKEILRQFEYSKEGYPADFWTQRNQLEAEGNWKKLPQTNTGGQVYMGRATLESADAEKMLEDGSFDAVYSNELFEYGALYFPSEEEKWNEISRANLEIIFRKLKEGGVFVSRTMRSHVFTEEQLKAVGFEVVCFNLQAETFRKPYGSTEGIDEVNRAYVVVCKKPLKEGK